MVGRVVIVAVAVLVALPAVAQAAVKQKVRQSADEVRAYWTAERMKSAKPKRLERGTKSRPNTSSSSWTSFEAPLRGGAYADKRHGKVFFSDGGTNYVCSGTALVGSVVWTAGHCVVRGGGAARDEHANWMFVPAYRDGAQPYGSFASTSFAYTRDWDESGQYGQDFAAASVDGLEAAIGTGFGLATGYDDEASTATSALGAMQSHGYPAAGTFDGRRQHVCSSSVVRRDPAYPPTMAINCDSTGGSSGGGWINSAGEVASVNSYGYGHLPNTMFGPVQGAEAAAVYRAALAG